MSELKCVVVTPERTELSVYADLIVVPMYDGQLGILKGKSPLVGRLGFGTLDLHQSGRVLKYYVEGGFVQVNKEGVYVLTDRLTPADKVDAAKAKEDFEKATAMTALTAETVALRDRALASARARIRLTKSTMN